MGPTRPHHEGAGDRSTGEAHVVLLLRGPFHEPEDCLAVPRANRLQDLQRLAFRHAGIDDIRDDSVRPATGRTVRAVAGRVRRPIGDVGDGSAPHLATSSAVPRMMWPAWIAQPSITSYDNSIPKRIVVRTRGPSCAWAALANDRDRRERGEPLRHVSSPSPSGPCTASVHGGADAPPTRRPRPAPPAGREGARALPASPPPAGPGPSTRTAPAPPHASGDRSASVAP